MKRLFGGILMAAGILLMTGSGLCTLAVIVIGFSEGSPSDGFAMLPLPLIVGGLPFCLGLGAFFWGRALVRRFREKPPSNAELADRFE